jgi:sialic acid synthase SpsE
VRAVRELETALGSRRKVLSATELENRIKYRRSAHLRREVVAGELLVPDLVEFRRPGFGISPSEYERYIGMRFTRGMHAGERVSIGDLTAAE